MNDSPSIMLIRPAEPAGEGELAVDRRGHPDPQSLGVTGWMRAGALVRLFSGVEPAAAGAPTPLARPQHLVAAAASPAHPSSRPRDTLQPLAEALGLAIDDSHADDTPLAAFAAHLHRLPGPVLVCWPHAGLPALANELLQRAEAPGPWPQKRHDIVWVVTLSGLRWSLVQVPQRLLAGDANQSLRRRVPARA